MTWRKRIGVGVSVLTGMVISAGVIGYILHKSQPKFYHVYSWTPEQRKVLSVESENSLADLNDFFLQRTAALHPTTNHSRRVVPGEKIYGETLTITFSEEKLNAFASKWADIEHWDLHKYDAYFTDPGIFFDNGHIVLAATVKETGSVVSLHFAPSIDDQGQLHLDLVSTLSGDLPLPRMALSGQLEKLESSLRNRLPAMQKKATLDADGRANGSTVEAAMSQLLLNGIESQPSTPILFARIWEPNKIGYGSLRVTAIKVDSEQLTITVRLLTNDEKAQYFQQIKALPVTPGTN